MSITVSPLSQTVSEGGVATFIATASGIKTRSGEFEYEWWKLSNGQQQSVMVKRKKRLQIQNVKIKDGGYYNSIVSNQWGNNKISESVHLIVSGKVQIYML